MSDRIGLQLYSVRDLASQDYEATVRKVAAMGYTGVEVAGFPGTTPEKAAGLFKELGLSVAGAHIALPLGDKKNEVLETMDALGKPRMVCPWASPDLMKTVDGVRGLCDTLNEANEVARANGMEFGYHNHHAEFMQAEGQYVYQLFQKFLDPTVFFELDTYWIKVAGCDPVAVVNELGKRAPVLHIKDGPGNREEPMTAAGEGIMDFPAILKASGDNSEWWIFEMDRCATDVMEAVQKSYTYLKGVSL